MSSLREPMNLGTKGYSYSCRVETRGTHWKKLHAHQGIEILYVHHGSGEIALEGERHPLHAGTLMLFQPYQLHRVEVPASPDGSYIRTNLTFDPHLAERWLEPFPALRFFFRSLWRGALRQQVFQLQGDVQLEQLLDGFERSRRESPLSQDELGFFFLELMRHLRQRVFAGLSPAVGQEERTVRQAESMLEWIEQHFREPFQLGRMAEELHLSVYHLSRLFKSLTGQTLSDCIAARRVREACSLLMLTGMPVKAVAREVGGLSTAYFCQLFKKRMGITPQAYREAVRSCS